MSRSRSKNKYRYDGKGRKLGENMKERIEKFIYR